ncbi:hypothetical protein BGX38DRAFT_1168696 [Terfezia claveryi]|nr:hypothetical protein BGX38DRAFT_1168696 [Terfezia claveryi]
MCESPSSHHSGSPYQSNSSCPPHPLIVSISTSGTNPSSRASLTPQQILLSSPFLESPNPPHPQ